MAGRAPFTNTELIAGTKGTGWSRPVEPEEIAAAVVKALDKPKTHVSVPAGIRPILTLITMLGPRGRRWVNRRAGSDRLFLEFDVAARRPYEERAQAATGLLDDGSDR